jgi:dipeptidyl aminopeptidase/acylaminoacyl peptidase
MMSFTLPRDVRGSTTYHSVKTLLDEIRAGGIGLVVDVTDLAATADGMQIACTAWRRVTASAENVSTVAVLDAVTSELRSVVDPLDGVQYRMPQWAPDESRLLCLRTTSEGMSEPWLLDSRNGSEHRLASTELPGTVEAAAWSPDGRTVAVLVAEPGAEISDVYGSGRVTASVELPEWLPEVSADGSTGWRRIWLINADTGELTPVRLPLNVWEFCWAGSDQIAVLTSTEPSEDAWYDAELRLVQLNDGTDRLLYTHVGQLATPRASADARWITVIRGTASDRGLVAGDIVMIDVADGSTRDAVVSGIHVTSQQWCPTGGILLSGLRGQDTVLAHLDANASGFIEVWSTSEAFGPGDLLPTAVPCGLGGAAVVLESHLRPPTVGVVRVDGFNPLLELTHEGTAAAGRHCSEMRAISWESVDGQSVDGYLALPSGPTRLPLPLVVLVHGGPVWRWRDVWLERTIQLPLLLAHGYAVLQPNPRGSQGYGEDYVRAIVGEIGGRDVDDVVAGIDAVVRLGLVDRDRVGVMGSSYGGYLAAWIATRPGLVAAAVAVSPVTDWVSQHFTTNIPQSDVRFLTGQPLDSGSQYRSRSPLVAATAQTCPLLLTAGLLDLATPPSQAVEMQHALVELGVDSDFAIYPREGHDVHDYPAVLDHCTRVLLWFNQFLRGQVQDVG